MDASLRNKRRYGATETMVFAEKNFSKFEPPSGACLATGSIYIPAKAAVF